MIKGVATVMAVVLVSGCAQVPRQPIDVRLMPDDCANRYAIINWLESVVAQTSTRDYPNERYINEIKGRIWSLRYRCQPV